MAVIAYPLETGRPIHGAGRRPRYLSVVREVPDEQSGTRAPVVTLVQPRPRARGRQLLAVLAVVALAAALWFGLGGLIALRPGAPMSLAGARVVPGGYAYTVRPGDTIWSIASAVAPSADPRPLVSAIESRLHSASVYPGERILIPTA